MSETITLAAGSSSVVTSALQLFSQFAIVGGGLWAVWGVITLAGGLKDQNGPATQSGVWQVVGGGLIIAAAALFLFGITAGLCSLLGLVLKSVLVDSVIESLNRRKAFIIITSDPRMVSAFITHDLARGATIWRAQGAYTLEEHWVVLTVLTRGQAVLLRRSLKEHDPHSFMIVTNSSEIFGKGFLRA